MTHTVQAIGGILLALPSGSPREERSKVEQSLLHAWFSSRQRGVPTKFDHLSWAIGRIGWNLTDAETIRTDIGTRPGESIVASLGLTPDATGILEQVLSSTLPVNKRVINAWRDERRRAEATELYIAEYLAPSRLAICSFRVQLAEPVKALSTHAAAAGILAMTDTYRLDASIFAGLAPELLARTAHLLHRIERASPPEPTSAKPSVDSRGRFSF